jgi:molybdenum cofactor biosynthesis protein A
LVHTTTWSKNVTSGYGPSNYRKLQHLLASTRHHLDKKLEQVRKEKFHSASLFDSESAEMVQIRILTSGRAMDPIRLFHKSCAFRDADRPMQNALRRRGIIRRITLGSSFRTFSLVSVAPVEEDVAAVPAMPFISRRPRLDALRHKLQSESPDVSRQIFKSPPVDANKGVVVQSTKQTPLDDVPSHGNPLEHVRSMLSQMPDPELSTLTDRHGRFHNYLRISVAERCNLRCTYCMPEQGVPLQPKEQLLSTPEILRLARTFVQAGVNKFRLTGGEPTLRADLVDIIAGLNQIDTYSRSISQRRSIGMTTNGIVLSQHLEDYHSAGLTGVNISLDTLEDAKFSQLTRRPPAYLSRVWQSLDHAMELAQKDKQFTVKLNCVVMRGTNDQEIADFVRLTDQYPGLQVRFIEYMPFSDNGWNSTMCVPFQELLTQLRQDPDPQVHLSPISTDDLHDTTKWYQTPRGGRVGFITSMSEHFCGTCNRLRLTADGQLKVCLFDGSSDHDNMISLRDAVRANWREAELRKLIYLAVQKKHAVLGGHTDPTHIMKDAANNRPMTLIGG